MLIRNMSIDLMLHLRTFLAVAQLGSFSSAADELRVGQPLLSRRIRALEEEWNTQLFDRSKRRIQLTAAGEALIAPARDLLARAELIEQLARGRGSDAIVRLGLPPDCEPRSGARLMGAAAQRGLRLEIVELPPRERAAALADRSVTAAVLGAPPDAARFSVHMGLASPRLPDVARRREIRLDDLRPRRGEQRRRILVTAEDSSDDRLAGLREAAARAGLAAEQIVPSVPSPTALSNALATADLMLCSRQFAVRNRITWAALADIGLRRCYRLDGDAEHVRILGEELGAPLAAALGAGSTDVTTTGALLTVEGWAS
jgi:DNA-binding transcriptional LysR family regulator